jgi:hypothetical protein
MKRQLTIGLLLVIILTGGCVTILKKLKHVSNPKFESEESVASFLRKVNNHYKENLFLCKDSAAFFNIFLKIHALPEAVFFNSKGEIIRYSEDPCPAKAQTFIMNMQEGQKLTIDTSYNLGFLKSRINPYIKNWFRETSNDQFTMVVFWAVWVGKVNNNVFEIVEALKARPDLHVRVVFINMDLLDSWGLKHLPKFKSD